MGLRSRRRLCRSPSDGSENRWGPYSPCVALLLDERNPDPGARLEPRLGADQLQLVVSLDDLADRGYGKRFGSEVVAVDDRHLLTRTIERERAPNLAFAFLARGSEIFRIVSIFPRSHDFGLHQQEITGNLPVLQEGR